MSECLTPVNSDPSAAIGNADSALQAGYQRCVRCIMDTTDPTIEFDSRGQCSHCANYDRRMGEDFFADQPEVLDNIVQRIRDAGRSKPYDCLIGVSGGVDSTYVAYTMHRLGLRPLAIHLDNGWNSELAVGNIERTVKRLNIDLHTHVVDWAEFRDLHRAFLKAGVANSETPTDHAILAILYKEACKRGIKHIIGGGNLATESVMPLSWMYDPRDLRHLKDIHRQFGTTRLRTFPTLTVKQFVYWTFMRGIRTVPILNYVPYSKKLATDTLVQELDWVPYGGKHFESIYTKWFQAFLLPHKFNIDKRLAHYSSLILSGEMTREEALSALSESVYDEQTLADDTEYVRKKIGLTKVEMNEVIDGAVRSFADYKNSEQIFRGMPRAMKFVKRVATSQTGRRAA